MPHRRRHATDLSALRTGDGESQVTTFTVFGPPATKGSTVAFMGKHGVVTKADCKTLAGWTQAVGWAARAAQMPLAPRDIPVRVQAVFQFVRPQRSTRPWPTVRPDLDKLSRALLDALTGVAYEDDDQVTELRIDKVYSATACTVVNISQLR
ncbi:MAG TPA: RusA family crossover junction endodeoxyribonuclease [Gemmatimonadales bacterium]|nr:RusA family crossover junction endodeoxyribonuclease [Gemmatimonadales bacterium]